MMAIFNILLTFWSFPHSFLTESFCDIFNLVTIFRDLNIFQDKFGDHPDPLTLCRTIKADFLCARLAPAHFASLKNALQTEIADIIADVSDIFFYFYSFGILWPIT